MPWARADCNEAASEVAFSNEISVLVFVVLPGGGADGAGDEEVLADEGVDVLCEEHAEGNDTLGDELRSPLFTRGPRGKPRKGDELGEAEGGDDVACDDCVKEVEGGDELGEAERGDDVEDNLDGRPVGEVGEDESAVREEGGRSPAGHHLDDRGGRAPAGHHL